MKAFVSPLREADNLWMGMYGPSAYTSTSCNIKPTPDRRQPTSNRPLGQLTGPSSHVLALTELIRV